MVCISARLVNLNLNLFITSTALFNRAAVFLKAADLLAGKYRAKVLASTILGQASFFLLKTLKLYDYLIIYNLTDKYPILKQYVFNR